MLRILLALAVAAAAAWGGYWFVGARALDQTIAQLLQDHPVLSVDDHVVRGFPNRFDLTLTAPRLEAEALAWQGPFLQVFALSYRPHHLIVVLPNDQQARMGETLITLQAADTRASLVMTPSLTLPLERLALVMQSPLLQIGTDSHRADALRIATRSTDPRLHEAVIEIETGFPDPDWMDRLDPAGAWPRRYDIVRLEGQVQFDRPLDRTALEAPLIRPTAVELTGGRLAFDGIDLRATGAVELDEAGRLSGPVTLTVAGWPELLERLTSSGTVDAEQAGFLRGMLSGMADPATPETVELPMTLRDGALAMGPVVLLRMPPLF